MSAPHTVALTAFLALGPATVAAPAPLAAQGWATADLALARFRRPSDSLLVQAIVRVPTAALERVAVGDHAEYRCTVLVTDAAGQVVWRDSRTQVVPPAELDRPGAGAVARVEFVLPGGRHNILVTITDAASGRRLSADRTIEPLPSETPVSDLLLEPRAGVAGALAYYLELYSPDRPGAGRLSLRVEDSAGSVRWLGAGEEVPPFLGVAPRRGEVDLPPLGPGGYRLIATAELAGRRGTGEAAFDVPPAVPGAAAAPPPPRDAFALASEAQLDSLYGPLLYLMIASERGVYPALSLAERRAFLRTFWAGRDPTPGTPRNEAQEDFYGRVQEVNRRFREGGAAEILGWRTDRGRIYIRNGPPDAVLSRPQPGWTNPYEAWKYSRGRERVYVFFDLTRFGNYALIWTNDRLETGLPNGRELLGVEALEDISQFSGLPIPWPQGPPREDPMPWPTRPPRRN